VISFPCHLGATYQLHFYINPEKWLECEVTENGIEIDCQIKFPSTIDQSFSFTISKENLEGSLNLAIFTPDNLIVL
jgi:hypothetical protein